MYHIKPDKRSRNSAAEVLRGMQLCLREKPLREITVTDIHRAAGISRATFYRLFDTPEDVLVYHFDTMLETEQEKMTEQPTTLSMLEQTIAVAMEYHEFFEAVVDNGRFDLLYRYTERHLEQLGRRYAREAPTQNPVENSYLLSQISMSMVAALITWERNGRKETPSEIVGYMRKYVRLLQTLEEMNV